ncbi:SAM-dependent DNA methyltransferase, partial [Phocaeicola vulgatus]|nr:SAM-dependent DNA methyltransferase [Phocaeicola vulgatus]
AHDDGSGKDLTGDELLSFVNNTLFVELKNIEIKPTTPIRQAIVKTTIEDANQYMKDGVQLRQELNVIDGMNLR